jgi:hypothetical protein
LIPDSDSTVRQSSIAFTKFDFAMVIAKNFFPHHDNVKGDWPFPNPDFLSVALMTAGARMATPVFLNALPI